MSDKVWYAIKQLNKSKAAGPDNVHAGIIKLLVDNSVKVMTKLFNKIYKKSILFIDRFKSHFITLSKKPDAKKCQDLRTIRFINPVFKVQFKMSNEQFNFKNSFSTYDALFDLFRLQALI